MKRLAPFYIIFILGPFFYYIVITTLYFIPHYADLKNNGYLKQAISAHLGSDLNFFKRKIFSSFHSIGNSKIQKVYFHTKVTSLQNLDHFYESYNPRQPCLLVFEKKDYPCRFKLHSQNPWHRKSLQKSLDLKLEESLKLINTKRLSMIKPKIVFFPMEKIFSDIANQIGLITPKIDIVLGYINNSYVAPYILRESYSDDFFLVRGLSPGAIIDNDVESYYAFRQKLSFDQFVENTEKGYDKNEIQDAWDTKSEFTFNGFSHFSPTTLTNIYKKNLKDRYNLDYLAKYFALLTIFNDTHFDSFTNFSLYIDLIENKFYPIPNDIAGTVLENSVAPLANLPLWNVLKDDFEFMEKFKSELSKLINRDNVIEKSIQKIFYYIKELEGPIRAAHIFETFWFSNRVITRNYENEEVYPFPKGVYSTNFEMFKQEAYLNIANLLYRKQLIIDSLLPNKLSKETPQKIKDSCFIKDHFEESCHVQRKRNSMNQDVVIISDYKDVQLNNLAFENTILFLKNSDHIILENLNFKNNSALVIMNTKKIKFLNSTFSKVFGHGFTIYNSPDTILKNVRFDNILKTPLKCVNSSLNIKNIHFEGYLKTKIQKENCKLILID